MIEVPAPEISLYENPKDNSLFLNYNINYKIHFAL